MRCVGLTNAWCARPRAEKIDELQIMMLGRPIIVKKICKSFLKEVANIYTPTKSHPENLGL